MYWRYFSATGSSCEGVTRLSTNGARRETWRPLLHAGDASAVKAPLSIAAVGTNACSVLGCVWTIVPWYPPQTKHLFRAIGPASAPAKRFRERPSSRGVPVAGSIAAKALVALNR